MCQNGRSHFAQFACKRLIPLVTITLFAALSSLGCQPDSGSQNVSSTPDSTTKAPPGAGSGESFKVALVMSGLTSDKGWNAGAYKAFEAIRKELNLSQEESQYVENQTSTGDQEKNLRAFASKGFHVIFGHGHEYEDLALRMEKDFPKTLFVISSGGKVGKNTMPIVYKLEDGAYLLGMLAAGMTKTGKLAQIGGMPIPPVKSVFAAFEAGAKAVKPDVKIIPPVYTQSWDDPGKAKEATLPLLDQGADIIMQDVDAAAQGVFNAVQERSKAGKTVYTLGTNSNQNDMAPDVVLASAPIYSEKLWVNLVKEAKAGTLKPSDKPNGMPEGIIDFVLNPALESKIPADLKTKLEDTKKQITSGAFVVPRVTARKPDTADNQRVSRMQPGTRGTS